MVVERNGVMVPYRSGWHEVELGVVGGQLSSALRDLSYVRGREPMEWLGPPLLAEAARRGALGIVGGEGPRRNRATLRRG